MRRSTRQAVVNGADETVTKSNQTSLDHSYACVYDMRSQLTDANISGIIGIGDWVADFAYSDAGNMTSRTIQSNSETFDYTGHQMTDADGNGLAWDENGRLLTGVDVNLVWNWDGMLRSATKGSKSVSLKYDPSGNRIFKDVNDSGSTTARKYIVDIVGDLPVILLELDPDNDMHIEKIYIYGNSQILAQHEGDYGATRYFYLHDRLGSVRQVIDTMGKVVNHYTYRPFGELYPAPDFEETVTNPFKFTGQFYDFEINEYYLRARMYDPHIGRFTARDPVRGKFKEPLTLHKYLYCGNDPVNYLDADGRVAIVIGGSFSGNITATDLASGFVKRVGLRGIGALAARYSVILPALTALTEMRMITDRVGWGGTAGAGFVSAWDHTRGLKGLNDRDAWSWGTMQWVAGGFSGATGTGGAITLDVGISNATHVLQLAGPFVEGGGSVKTRLFGGLVIGATLSRGMNQDGSWSDIWLGTLSFGGGTRGWEAHAFVGYSFVQEHGGW